MKVHHCPSCGSDEIDVSSYSAEYMSSTRYECETCDWFYKNGSGMGTGSGNAGTHPRSAGNWCHECETCAKPGFCRCVNPGDKTICNECMNIPPTEFRKIQEGVTSVIKLPYRSGATCTSCNTNEAEYKIV